jgi:hypothetical protein
MPAPITYRYVLDETKRGTVVALVANGSSRRVAARYVGCAPSTITRTAARDPQFGAELAHAEQMAEINLLRAIQAAGKKPKYWRAAAWLLERRNVNDFGRRSPNMLTDEQVAEMINQMVEVLHEDVSEENYARALRKLDQLLVECKSETEPIILEPREDARDEDPPYDDALDDDEPCNDDPNDERPGRKADELSPTADPLHLADATNHPEVEIDLRTEDQDATA